MRPAFASRRSASSRCRRRGSIGISGGTENAAMTKKPAKRKAPIGKTAKKPAAAARKTKPPSAKSGAAAKPKAAPGRMIGVAALDDIAVGVAILGTGGGCIHHIGKTMALQV